MKSLSLALLVCAVSATSSPYKPVYAGSQNRIAATGVPQMVVPNTMISGQWSAGFTGNAMRPSLPVAAYGSRSGSGFQVQSFRLPPLAVGLAGVKSPLYLRIIGSNPNWCDAQGATLNPVRFFANQAAFAKSWLGMYDSYYRKYAAFNGRSGIRCGNEKLPVCANGVTYPNICFASLAGVVSLTIGACNSAGVNWFLPPVFSTTRRVVPAGFARAAPAAVAVGSVVANSPITVAAYNYASPATPAAGSISFYNTGMTAPSSSIGSVAANMPAAATTNTYASFAASPALGVSSYNSGTSAPSSAASAPAYDYAAPVTAVPTYDSTFAAPQSAPAATANDSMFTTSQPVPAVPAYNSAAGSSYAAQEYTSTMTSPSPATAGSTIQQDFATSFTAPEPFPAPTSLGESAPGAGPAISMTGEAKPKLLLGASAPAEARKSAPKPALSDKAGQEAGAGEQK